MIHQHKSSPARWMRLGLMLLTAATLLMSGALGTQAARAATFNVTYTDADGTGFYDNSGGSPSLGERRRTAFEAALASWSNRLGASPIAIGVTATFQSLGGSSTSATLGQAGPTGAVRDFTSSNPKFRANTFYGYALADHLAAQDINGAGAAEIAATFNSDIDTGNYIGGKTFYYGLDANPPANTSDFYTVALHEIGHGLNFLSLVHQDGTYAGTAPNTFPGIFDRFLIRVNGGTTTRMTAMTDAERAAAITSGQLFFDGTSAQAGNGGTPAAIYAPASYQSGSSVSHLDEATYPGLNANNLLTPVYSGPQHDAGPVGYGIFNDMGWSTFTLPLVTSITRADASPTSSTSVKFTVNFNTPVTGVDASDFSLTATGNLTGAQVQTVSGSGIAYTVTVGGYSGSTGTLRLNVIDDNSINDNGTALGGTAVGDGNFTGGEAYTFPAPAAGTVTAVIAVNGNDAKVISIDPSTAPSGTQAVLASSNPPLTNSYGVARATDGTLYVTNFSAGSVVKIPLNGSPTALSSGNLLNEPFDIVIGPDSQLYVSDYANQSIVRINPTNGSQTLISSNGGTQGNLINTPVGLAFGSDGKLYVGNYGNHNILSIDVTTGVQSIYISAANLAVGNSGYYCSPWGIAFGTDGTLYVDDSSPNNRIARVAPGGGTVSNVTALANTEGLAFASDGMLYAATGGSNTIVRVNPVGGTQTVITSAGNLDDVADIALASQAPVATITGFTPPSGTVGTAVTITGTLLTDVTSVKFNGTPATDFHIDSATQITATVPPGATTGKISVSTATTTATSTDSFIVLETPSLIVTTTSDASTNTDNLTSLREAIAYANSRSGADTITFALPDSEKVAGVWTIAPTAAGGALVLSSDGTSIDASTQAGSTKGSPAVILAGSNAAAGSNGLLITAANCSVQGFKISGWSGAGIAVTGNASLHNYLRPNFYANNGGPDIDLGADGATANDSGDADSGPNDLQNTPVIKAVGRMSGSPDIAISVALDGLPGHTYIFDFFASSAQPGVGGSGNVDTVLARTATVTADSSGQILAPVTVPVTAGHSFWSATATDLTADSSGTVVAGTVATGAAVNQTSEMSAAVVTVVDDVIPTVSVTTPAAGPLATRLTSISGTAGDDKGVQRVVATLRRASDLKYWNGSQWVAGSAVLLPTTYTASAPAQNGSTSGTWRVKSALPSSANLGEDKYSITAFAYDIAQNRATAMRAFTVLEGPPSVTITTPADGSLVDSLFSASGTASDGSGATAGSGIQRVDALLYCSQGVNAHKWWTGTDWSATKTVLATTYDAAQGTWLRDSGLPNSGLVKGKYSFYAYAYDKRGNLTIARSIFTCN